MEKSLRNKCKVLTLFFAKEKKLLCELESRVKYKKLMDKYGIARGTIYKILRTKDRIMAACGSVGKCNAERKMLHTKESEPYIYF